MYFEILSRYGALTSNSEVLAAAEVVVVMVVVLK